ncbi:hypothetical protein R3Q06_27515 [Rhodococcus erythropolis]|uniref:hypothetical protein n=1 Tax=Rhodococcus erythropolis TaxID=1833 RepID=UPI00294A51A4|nr:hypothetical protein [Rhodococcus erythropolis]MDV6277249.1 hypothetical protein [Rhodococcus erythropolis]
MIRSITSRRCSLRKLAYTPLVAAVAVGALCAGAGISTATPEPAKSTDIGNDMWTLTNRTGQPISGLWTVNAYGSKSSVETSQDKPWAPDETVSGNTVTWAAEPPWGWEWEGHICYNKHWWDFKPQYGYWNTWSMEVDTKGTLHATYRSPIGTTTRIPLQAKTDTC